MRFLRSSQYIVLPVILLIALAGVSAQQRGGGGRGGGGRGRGAFPNLTLTTTAWPDGGMIPLRYTQAGPEISPAIQWSAPPRGHRQLRADVPRCRRASRE
ncbi:MAG: hypothetical protein WBY44_11610 [Bryobacteraceae bacterium]